MRISRAISVRTSGSTSCFGRLVILACLAPLGCTSSGKQMQADLYQRELRLQEDEIYRLEDCLCEYQDLVRGYRAEVAELKRDLETAGAGSSAPTRKKSSSSSLLSRDPEPLEFSRPQLPGDEPRGGSDRSGASERVESFELPEEAPPFQPTLPDSAAPGSAAEPLDAAPLFQPGPTDSSQIEPQRAERIDRLAVAPLELTAVAVPQPKRDAVPELIAPAGVAIAGPKEPAPFAGMAPPLPFAPPARTMRRLPEAGAVERVVLSALPSTDPQDGSPLLLATLRPLVEDEPSRFAGTVSLMLIDPHAVEAERYLARWDFNQEEVALGVDSQGVIRLSLALPDSYATAPPESLQLWTRMIDDQGRKTLATIDWPAKSTDVGFASAEQSRAEEVAQNQQPELMPEVQKSTPQEWQPSQQDTTIRVASFDEDQE
ncbi:hypothetical protein [Botrimarina hoheduenensis]|uniref:Uncharacterized protein n=1 Tax=Botrimarina hoheduenensis TaxID=2528000 RepID=A0A5C5WEK2_9BACT|nr:hypothetical protein [Botrimarina hoheduenensis]TWT48501.1 hypothetical protein Pla111_02710 [Botrimarina hoheduenensis]